MDNLSFTREQIKDWNSQPAVAPSNVRLVPKEDADSIEVDKHRIKRKNITIFLLVIVVACFGVLTFLAYSGDLKLASCAPSLNLSCSAVQCSSVTMPAVNVPACPVCPTNNFTCSPTIRICGNSTC